MVELKGVVPALTTPFTEDRALDLAGFRTLIGAVLAEVGLLPSVAATP